MKIHSLSADDSGVVLQFSVDKKSQYSWAAEIFRSLVSNNLCIELPLFDEELETMAGNVLKATKQPLKDAILILSYSSRDGKGHIQMGTRVNDKGQKKAAVGNS